MFMDSQNKATWNLMAQDLLNDLTYFVRCKKKKSLFCSRVTFFYNCTASKG